MAVTHQLSFGGRNLLGTYGKIFRPSDGPVDYQTLRRHPFGLQGELELRGQNGGQTILISARIFSPSFSAARNTVNAIRARQGTRERLSLVFGAGAGDSYGEVTLDSVGNTEPQAIAFSTDATSLRYQTDVAITFRKLHQDD